MRYNFVCGKSYTKKDIYRIIGLPENTKGGNWDTGYNKYKKDWFIFCNVGVSGRIGHNHNNQFIGDELLWFGKTGSKKEHPTIQSLANPEGKIYIFTRANNLSPFTYTGAGRVKLIEDTSPVKISWEFINESKSNPINLPEEVTQTHKYIEGATKQISVNSYERNPNARQRCIEHYGIICQICRFRFDVLYGAIGEGFIHVHHLKPLSEIGKEYELDPIKDLRPVCANCHAMIHTKKPAYSIEELKDIIRDNSKLQSAKQSQILADGF